MASVSVEDSGYWAATAAAAADLVGLHIDAVDADGSTHPDRAWTGLMRDLLDAVADQFGGDRLAALGALAGALDRVGVA